MLARLKSMSLLSQAYRFIVRGANIEAQFSDFSQKVTPLNGGTSLRSFERATRWCVHFCCIELPNVSPIRKYVAVKSVYCNGC